MNRTVFAIGTAALVLTTAAAFAQPAREEAQTWRQFRLAMADGTEPLLPDFSWAGYHYGEKAIPDVKGPVFDVTQFGAIPDDAKSDEPAFRKAIAAARDAGGGVIFFPAGEFLINTDSDKTETIVIDFGNVVVRGSGSGPGGTVIRMANHIREEDPAKMYSTPCKIEFIAPDPVGDDALATITGEARRETFTVTVDSAARLKPGDRVTLSLKSTEAIPSFFAPRMPAPQFTRVLSNGVVITERHTIAAIDGNTVTFGEPLHITVDPEFGWTLKRYTPIEEVGVEDICFQGSWEQEFVHHRSALDDGGWSAVEFSHVANSWLRRCTFLNWNVCLEVRFSSAVSVLNVTMAGNKGHFGIHTRGGYGVLAGYCRDHAGHHHGPSVGYQSVGAVYWRFEMLPEQRIDCHSTFPYATLLDRVDGGILYGSGGPMAGLPHHMRWYTLWNFLHPTDPGRVYDFWREGQKECFLEPIVVGIHGADVKFNESTLQIYESPGKPVDPESLYEAQLELRLGALPAWVEDVRATDKAMQAAGVPAHPTVRKGNAP
ncbi:MAG: hypothetical protein PWP23_1141 [Candidatus Sumerlaeota bacterium]|nr:hypothetical protein [Candidatus Sumerlaeota bacterium]